MNDAKPFATLITDGSFSPASRCGGWAGRLILEDQRSTWWGPVRNSPLSSNDCEIAAIGNCLHYALQGGELPLGTGVLLQVDNLRIRDLLADPWNFALALSPIERYVVEWLRPRLKSKEIGWLRARHIKAHVTRSERVANNHVHEAIDAFAKKGRRMAEAAKLKNEKELEQ